MLAQNLHTAFRSLIKQPAFTLAAVLTLALGIGANSAIFSLINGVLLEPLPYADDDQLVVLSLEAPKTELGQIPFSIKEVFETREASRGLSELAEYHGMTFTLLGRGEPERVATGVVSADFFSMLGIEPLYGRTFREEDDKLGAEAVLVLSYDYWQRSFGGDPEIVGQVFEMNNRPHTVIGVLPSLPQFPDDNDVYMATSACPFRAAGEQRMEENRSAFRNLLVFGRRQADTSLDQLRAELSTIAARFRNEHPETYPDEQGLAIDALPLKEQLTENARPTLFALLGTAVLVLLIACANAANLNVARMIRREKELAVRSALGAGRGHLVRQMLVEGSVLALLSGLVGLFLAALSLEILKTFIARFTPRAADISIDGTVLAFTLAVALLTGVLFALLPLLSLARDLLPALREGGQATSSRQRQRLRSLLIAAQVAVSVVLLAGAGLMLRSFYKLQQVETGFSAEHVLTARLTPNWSKYSTQAELRQFFDRLLDSLRAHPAAISVAASNFRPLNQQNPWNNSFVIEDQPLEQGQPTPQLDLHIATPDYFRTLGIPLIRGRTFEITDHDEAPDVAVINQSLARRYWPDGAPLGRRVSLNDGQSWITIVGIVGDVRNYRPETAPGSELYRPLAQAGWAGQVFIRTASDPRQIIPEVKEAVYAIDPQQPIDDIATLDQSQRETLASPRLTALLLGLFAALALLITATGISGIIAFSVEQRVQEIGVRLALGAEASKVVLMIVRQGMALVLGGLGVGLVGAFFFGRIFERILYQTSTRDPLILAAVSLVLLGIAVIACWLPASRATRVDPVRALRAE